MDLSKDIIVIRGGGDLATGIIQKFYKSGFKVLILEIDNPSAIRRSVALCEAVYTGEMTVEDVTARRIDSLDDAEKCWADCVVPLYIDSDGSAISTIKPTAVIDAIIAKRNIGTNMAMADITIGFGPGFEAGKDVNIAIETMRGHNLGRLIFEGSALENTGIPGEIGGKSELRVVHAPVAGIVKHINKLGDVVKEGETIFTIDDTPVPAPFTGLLRGLIREGFDVFKGMKIADIDPRTDVDWHTVSDKARCLGGAALEAYLYLRNKGG